MERDRLIQLLAGDTDALNACQQALRRGAPFQIFEDHLLPCTADHYARVYARRERRTRAAGTPTLGFREAVHRLRQLADQPLHLGEVTATSPPYHFQLFLMADLTAVVACLGVDQQRLQLRQPQQTDTV